MSKYKIAGLRQRKERALSWQLIVKWQGGTHPAVEFGPLDHCAEALCDHTKAKVQSDFSVGATGAFPGRVWSHRGDTNNFI